VEVRCRRSNRPRGDFSAAARLVTSRKWERRSFLTADSEFSEPKGWKQEAVWPLSLPDSQARGISVDEAPPVPTLFSQKLASLFLLLLSISMLLALRGDGVGERLATLSSSSGQPLSVELELECLRLGRERSGPGEGGVGAAGRREAPRSRPPSAGLLSLSR
jgi:hypothetical protein